MLWTRGIDGKSWCRRFNPVPAHHSFLILTDQRNISGSSIVPKVCPSRAHSSGLLRTSAVQAVATSSFQIQLGRGLLARSCLHLWAPVDLSRARFQAIVLDA